MDSQITSEAPAVPPFVPEQCLFCNKVLRDFAQNEAHMRLTHGFVVPYRDRLVVEIETLFAYLHLIVVGYNECISCGITRSSVEAVKQHMVAKGHCRFDITEEDPEFQDFYDLDVASSGLLPDVSRRLEGGEGKQSHREMPAITSEKESIRLPSGRIISSRSHPCTLRVPRAAWPSKATSCPRKQYSSTLSRVNEPRDAPAHSSKGEEGLVKRMARLSTKDERSLSHLSFPEQRAVITAGQKQTEKAQRQEQRMRGRLEGQGNVFLMTHFRKDASDKRTLWQ